MTDFLFRSRQESGGECGRLGRKGSRVFRVSPFRERVGDLLAHFGE